MFQIFLNWIATKGVLIIAALSLYLKIRRDHNEEAKKNIELADKKKIIEGTEAMKDVQAKIDEIPEGSAVSELHSSKWLRKP